jgi:hypothetical protein
MPASNRTTTSTSPAPMCGKPFCASGTPCAHCAMARSPWTQVIATSPAPMGLLIAATRAPCPWRKRPPSPSSRKAESSPSRPCPRPRPRPHPRPIASVKVLCGTARTWSGRRTERARIRCRGGRGSWAGFTRFAIGHKDPEDSGLGRRVA